MRYIKIFSLYFQNVFSHRGRPLVYVFTYVFSSILFLAFMQGVFKQSHTINSWSYSSVMSYYFLLIIAAAVLMSHPEVPVVRDDIEKGELAGRLLKPFSYYWQRFHAEIPVRIFQGIAGGVFFFLLINLFHANIQFNLSASTALLACVIIVLAYLLCFTFKMILAITALWTTDIRGAQELTDILITIFAGYIVPVNLLPSLLEKTAYILPFAYIIYYPIVAIQGKLGVSELLVIISIQVAWIIVLGVVFRFMWKKGLKQYADFGH
jgi:ABC-2 type transport system permease protein